jgi:Zn finger protein HypA/HybF involved in hydrogenase expression
MIHMSIGKIVVLRCKCERCGHKWTPGRGYRKKLESGKVKRLPRVCPACKNPLWNVKMGRKVNAKNKQ